MRQVLLMVSIVASGCGQRTGPTDQATTTSPDIEAKAPDRETRDVAAEPAKEWPASVPAMDGAEIGAARSTSRLSEIMVEAPGKDVAAVLAAWVERARGEGWEVVADHGHGVSLRRGGERAYMIVKQLHGARFRGLFGRGIQESPPIDGPCEPVPDRRLRFEVRSSGVDQRGEVQSGTRAWTAITTYGFDLDADGALDALVPVPPQAGACPWELEHEVWVMRGTCGHRLGIIGPGRPADEARDAGPDASGFVSLRTRAEKTVRGKKLVPEVVRTVTDFAVSDGAYRRGHSEVSRGTCHHCAVSSCILQTDPG